MRIVRILTRIFLIVFLLMVWMGLNEKVVNAQECIVVRTGRCLGYRIFDGEQYCVAPEFNTAECGKAAAQSNGSCGPGSYQVAGGGCRSYGPVSGNNSGDTGGAFSGCECGSRTCDGGECWCSPACNLAHCNSVFPQNITTDQATGNFKLYADGVTKPSNLKPGYPDYLTVTFRARDPDNSYHNYTGYMDTYGNWHAAVNLANHSRYGVIDIYAYVYRRGVLQDTCTSSFNRPRYISGKVYYDPGGTCSTAQPWSKTSDLIVGYNHTGAAYGADVVASVADGVVGKFVLGDVPATPVSLQLLNIPTDLYSCSACNAGSCPNKASVASLCQWIIFCVSSGAIILSRKFYLCQPSGNLVPIVSSFIPATVMNRLMFTSSVKETKRNSGLTR